jgi:acyl-CoA thioesterase-1
VFIHLFKKAVFVALAAFTLFGLFIPNSALSDQHHETDNDKSAVLLILGDSLSAGYGLEQQLGWVSLLQNKWQDEKIQIDIVNAAVSGETTDGGLARLPRLLEQHMPTHVLIELGGNDGLQGHNTNKIMRNLEKIVVMSKDSGAEVFIQDIQIPTNYGRRYTDMFQSNYDSVASAQNIVKIPFFLQNIALNEELMQKDGIHPNAKAQPLIADFMYEQLTNLILPVE